MDADNYPTWLADGLLNQTLDWSVATETTFSTLLSHVTLHDSQWYNTLVSEANTWLLVINLDAIWNRDFCHQLTDWPFLLIKFQQVVCSYQDFTDYDGNYRTISDAESGSLNNGKFAEWMALAEIADLLPSEFIRRAQASPDLQRTEITTIYGGLLTLIHKAPVKVLLFSEAGGPLAVNLPAVEQ